MTPETVKKIIGSIPSIKWSGLLESSELWVVISELPLGNHHLGIDVNGNWVTEGESGLVDMLKDRDFEALMRLLETLSVSQFISYLKECLNAASIPESVIESFSFDEFLLYAAGRGEYWKALAYQWVTQGYPMTYELALAFGDGSVNSKVVREWKKKRCNQILAL